jgi:hypothetical protein
MEKDVFELEKPESFNDLLSQIEFISKEIESWSDKIIRTNKVAQLHRELISESNTKDAFHNISQNIIDLSKLIQKKLQEG